jgi:hypothetical protein
MADNKPSTGGPKSADSKRDEKVSDTQNQGGADKDLQERRSTVFGDNTSSTGGSNNPGQHGRDGGEIDGTPSNPAPSESAVSGEKADDQQKEG